MPGYASYSAEMGGYCYPPAQAKKMVLAKLAAASVVQLHVALLINLTPVQFNHNKNCIALPQN
jgi:hypothetical protein